MSRFTRAILGAVVGLLLGGAIGHSLGDDVLPILKRHQLTTPYHEQLHCRMAWQHGWDGDCQITLVHPDETEERGINGYMSVNDGYGYVPEETRPSMDQEHAWIRDQVLELVTRLTELTGATLGLLIGALIGALTPGND